VSGDVTLAGVSTAERCIIIITTDQTTGERPRNNFLRTLRAHHMQPEERPTIAHAQQMVLRTTGCRPNAAACRGNPASRIAA